MQRAILSQKCGQALRLSVRARPSPTLPSHRALPPNRDYDPVAAREKILKNKAERQERKDDQRNIIIGGIGLFLLVIGGIKGIPFLEDVIYEADIGAFGGQFNVFDVVAAMMWSVSLYYVSPLQLLLLFLGKIETERPSDWFMYVLGKAGGLPVDTVDYQHPLSLRAITVLASVLTGFGIAFGFEISLGDPTWALSSGIGSLMAAGIYELGRPTRLSQEEAVELESQWQDFKKWADERCVPYGRAHQTEVINAFRKEVRKYSSVAVLSDDKVLDMIRNWHPGKLDRSGSGYLRNLGLKARVDPFSGAVTGTAVRPVPAAETPVPAGQPVETAVPAAAATGSASPPPPPSA